MSLITVAILFTWCFFAAASGYATCGLGIWAGTSCVNLLQCLQYWRPLERLRETDEVQHRSFLASRIQPAMCGFDRHVPMVCCSNEPSQVESTEPTANVNKPISCGNFLWNKGLSPDGMPAELEEFPWLALLEYETGCGRKFGCGGVLISDRHVLTAAHCLNPFGSRLISVRLGEHNLRTAVDCVHDPASPYCSAEAIDVGIEREIPHESYSNFWGASDFDNVTYDIAVLKLNRSVITDVIKPICLPDPPSEESAHRHVNVTGRFLSAGWGIDVDTVYPNSVVKLMSRLKQVSKTYCNDMYGRTLQEDKICALSKSPKNACIADSGGPLMGFNKQSKMSVMGIYSPADSQPCQKPYVPSTFVDVRRYVDWIKLQMQY